MISRILSVLILVALCGGAAYYFLRLTPERKVRSLREKVEALLQPGSVEKWSGVLDDEERSKLASQGKSLEAIEVRFDLARQAADQILLLFPRSEADLERRARIEVLAGNNAEALRYYDRLNDLPVQPAWVHLHRAAVLRRLGRFGQAQSELTSVVDTYPFRANMDMGRAELDFLRPEQGIIYFRKALEAPPDPDSDPALNRVEAQERIADTLTLLISLDEAVLRRSDSPGTPGGPSAGTREVLRVALADRRNKRKLALEDALGLLKKATAQTRSEFVRRLLRIGRLYGAFEDPERLREGIQYLQDAIQSDEDRRFWPVRIKIGELELALLAQPRNEAEARQASQEAVEAFQESLRFKELVPALSAIFEDQEKFDGSTAQAPPPPRLKESELRDSIILTIADRYLNSREDWRLLAAERDGVKDSLELASHLDRILRADPKEAKGHLGQVRVLKGCALLRAGKEKESEELLLQAAAASPEAGRAAYLFGIAETCLRAAPDSLLFQAFLDRGASASLPSERMAINGPFRLLTRAINHHRDALAAATDPAERQRREPAIAKLEQARKALIDDAVLRVDEVEEYLALAGVVSTLSGSESSIEILTLGKEKMLKSPSTDPRKLEALRLQLAARLEERASGMLAQARREAGFKSTPESPWWPIYRKALAEFLPLFKERPYRNELLRAVTGIIARFGKEGESPPPQLEELVAPLFPGAAPGELAALSAFFIRLAAGGFEEIVAHAGELESAKGLRPYSSLILGAVLFFQSQQLLEKQGGDPQDLARSLDLRERARRLYEAERERSPDYLPIRVELARLRLAAIPRAPAPSTSKGASGPSGGPVPDIEESLLQEIRELVARSQGREGAVVAYPILILQAQAIEKRFAHLESRLGEPEGTGPRLNTLKNLVEQRRSTLRRAIQTNPDLPDAFLALAETYLGGARSARLPADGGESARNLIEPDYEKALVVLRAAPATPRIQMLIGGIYQRYLRKPRDASDYYLSLVKRDPTEPAIEAYVGCLVAGADPAQVSDPKELDREGHANARKFLNLMETSLAGARHASAQEKEGFQVLKHRLLGLVDHDQARLASPPQARELKQSAIQHYRWVREWHLAGGKKPPMDVCNNLAWLLAEEKDQRANLDEAKKIILETRALAAELRLPEEQLATLHDTYGWILLQTGENESALGVYKSFVPPLGDLATSGYHYRFARAYFVNRQYNEAARELGSALSSPRRFEEQAEARKLQLEIEKKQMEQMRDR